MRFRHLAAFTAICLLLTTLSLAYEPPRPVAAERDDDPANIKHFAATIVEGDSEPGPVPLPPVKPVPVIVAPGGGPVGGYTVATGGVLLGATAGATTFDRVVDSEHRMRRTIRLLD